MNILIKSVCLFATHYLAEVPYLKQTASVPYVARGGRAKCKWGIAVAMLLTLSTGVTAPKTQAANLIFKTHFGADIALYPPRITYSTEGWQDLAGINPATGRWGTIAIPTITKLGFDMIAGIPVTLSTLNNHMSNEIQQVTGPDGNQVYALFQNLQKKHADNPAWDYTQNAFMLRREAVDSGDKTDTGDVYYSYWFKFQSDLHNQLGITVNDNWRVMSEWKTGGLNNTWRGDYRIITVVLQDSNRHLYWQTQGDNIANGIPAGDIYWRITNTSVPVPVGEWFNYEVFWHRSSGSDGRYWAAVNGQVIVDQQGPNMGIYNLPINRVMLTNAYSGGKTPIQQWLTGLEIWDGFPCGVGLSCYNTTKAVESSALSGKP